MDLLVFEFIIKEAIKNIVHACCVAYSTYFYTKSQSETIYICKNVEQVIM